MGEDAALHLHQGFVQTRFLFTATNNWKLSKGMHLVEILQNLRLSQASDPHDHLFALLGISEDRTDPAFEVNYDISIGDITESYARLLLKKYGTLEMLYYAGLQETDSSMPSWVCNRLIEQRCLTLLTESGSPLVQCLGPVLRR